jgi:hypothetical protein
MSAKGTKTSAKGTNNKRLRHCVFIQNMRMFQAKLPLNLLRRQCQLSITPLLKSVSFFMSRVKQNGVKNGYPGLQLFPVFYCKMIAICSQ